jgi:hypothetical protein
VVGESGCGKSTLARAPGQVKMHMHSSGLPGGYTFRADTGPLGDPKCDDGPCPCPHALRRARPF